MRTGSRSSLPSILSSLLLALALTACGGAPTSEEQSLAPATERPAATEQPTATTETLIEQPTSEPASQAPSADTPESIDACSLLSAAEAEAVLGKPVPAPQSEDPLMKPGGASAQGCRYRADSFNDVSLTVYRFADAEAARQLYSVLGDLGEDAEAVEGLGDMASGEDDDQTGLGLLNVLAGPYYFELQTLTDADNRLENLKAAAALVLERLP